MARTSAVHDNATTPSWSVGGLFLEALAVRDFHRLADGLTPEATLRALINRAVLAIGDGARQITDNKGERP
jgi:hypothetical protein